jgi:Trypsin-like peptidase domain
MEFSGLMELLVRTTVRLSLGSEGGHGSGFFVAPGRLLTCAHVVKSASTNESIHVTWERNRFLAQVELILEPPYPDLALLRVDAVAHPCVRLGEEYSLGDRLCAFGFPSGSERGDWVSIECEGWTQAEELPSRERLMKLKDGQISPGLSGAPLLNLRTGRVCGIVKQTRDRLNDLGGRAVPAHVALGRFGPLRAAQEGFHQRDEAWSRLTSLNVDMANPAAKVDDKRVIRIFVSCPGDMRRERDAIRQTVGEAAALFRDHGIHFDTWSYDRDALPTLGVDAQSVINNEVPAGYDLYVGLLCGRVGTATARAASGTLEEFETARRGWEAAGRPHVLFYFCAKPPVPESETETQDLERVLQFRRSYPGLYATFGSAADLRRAFQKDLIRIVHRLCFPIPVAPSASTADPVYVWVSDIVAQIDSLENAETAADWSAARPVRVLNKLKVLLDLAGLLSATEREVLEASLYVRTLRWRARALGHSIGSVLGSSQGPMVQHGKEIDLIVTAVELDELPRPSASKSPEVRLSLLTALVRVGECLDLDRNGLVGGGIGMPTTDSPAEWLAWFTPEIRVRRNGVITFAHCVPTPAWIEPVERMALAGLTALWQSVRTALTPHGITLATAPSETTISRGMDAPSESVLISLSDHATALTQRLSVFHHLGDDTDVPANRFLPIPGSAVAGPIALSVARNPGYEARLV